jgi:Rrf2 family transcriptional regulator, iron-sulfur cluster assembly transcription factor
MLSLTRKGDYAIRGLVYLAKQPEGSISLISEIAEGVQVPQSFVAKIFQSLAKTGLINSTRGTGGGFTLARSSSQITLLEIVEAIEGPIIPNKCIMRDDKCGLKPKCTVHPVWIRLQDSIHSILGGVTLSSLV